MPEGLAGVQWLAFGPNTFNVFVPFYTNVTTTPASFQTGPKFDLSKIFWVNKLNAQLGDTNYKVYSALEQAFEEKTMAKLRKIENETDEAAKNLTGKDLQEKLEEANQKMADLAYKASVDLTGEMVETGHGLMKLKYDLLD